MTAVNKPTKRQFSQDRILAHYPAFVAGDISAKDLRTTVMNEIRELWPDITEGSLGAVYNDGKHQLVNKGEIEAFGRHGKGRNHHTNAAAAQAPVNADVNEPEPQPAPEQETQQEAAQGAWCTRCKDSNEITGYYDSRRKAYAAKTDNEKVTKA